MANYTNSELSPIDFSDQCTGPDPSYHHHILIKSLLGLLYGFVFMTAVCGNSLVIYVVATNKSMQSVTNLFITNLALSDILVNFTSLWLTPVYIYLDRWVWGLTMCHLVPLFQGMSTFISSLTLMAIAIDRYVAILHPFRARISKMISVIVVGCIWLVALVLVMPLAVHMQLYEDTECQLYICRELWASPRMRVVYGFVVLSLQFGVPFIVIAYCYIRIWVHLTCRRSMIVQTSRSSTDDRRRGRLLKMLVAMVVIYLLAWLPVNSLNVLRDLSTIDGEKHFVILFLFAHLCSMSSTCWNPIVYAWMAADFRREFKAVLPCFKQKDRCNGRNQSMTWTATRKSLITSSELSVFRASMSVARNSLLPKLSPSRGDGKEMEECKKLMMVDNLLSPDTISPSSHRPASVQFDVEDCSCEVAGMCQKMGTGSGSGSGSQCSTDAPTAVVRKNSTESTNEEDCGHEVTGTVTTTFPGTFQSIS